MGGFTDSDLPKVQSIQLGWATLEGDSSNDRKMMDHEPFNYKNTLTMRSQSERKDE